MLADNQHPGVDLPPEILLDIFEMIQSTCTENGAFQSTLHSCVLVSHKWYAAAIPTLYKSPYLTHKNCDSFLNLASPSGSTELVPYDNLRLSMVKRLDMGLLVDNGSGRRIFLATRLLEMCKQRLEDFVAPQTSTLLYGIEIFFFLLDY